MKKVFTLVMMMLVAGTTCVFADVDETFQFMDKDGNVLADGTELVRDEIEDDGFTLMVPSGLYVKNVSDAEAELRIDFKIESIDHGSHQICFPMSCTVQYTVENGCTGKEKLDPDEAPKSIAAEWIPGGIDEDGDRNVDIYYYGECRVVYQIVHLKKKVFSGYEEIPGATVIVNYKYSDDPSGINLSTRQLDNSSAIYDLQGRQLQSVPQHGIYIQNGKKYVK